MLFPLVYLTLRAIGAPARVVHELFFSWETYRILFNSLFLTVGVTSLATIIAVPAAFLTVRTDLKYRRFWQVGMVLPLVIPSYVGAFALIGFFGPRGSMVQTWLEPLGVRRLPSIYGLVGAVIVLALYTYPYLYLTVRAALQRLDPSLEEAGRSLGESPWGVFSRVTLPQLMPAIGAGGLLVGLYTLSDFGAVSLLQFDSFTRMIYVEYSFSFDRYTAAFYALILVLLSSVLILIENWLANVYETKHSEADDSRLTPRDFSLGKLQLPAQIFLGFIIGLAVVLPSAVSGSWMIRGIKSGEPTGLVVGALFNSVFISLVAALLCLVFALPASFYIAWSRKKLAFLIEKLCYIGYALPGIVLGLALVFVATGRFIFLYQTVFLLLIG